MTKLSSLSIIEADSGKAEGFATISVPVAIRRRVQVKCDNMVKAGTLHRATAPPRLVRYFKTLALHTAWLAGKPLDGAETRTTITANAAKPDGFHMKDLPEERRMSAYKHTMDMRLQGLIFIAEDKRGLRYFDTPAHAVAWKTAELLRLPPPAIQLDRGAKSAPSVIRGAAVTVYPPGFKKTVHITPPSPYFVEVPMQRIGTASWINLQPKEMTA